MTKHKALGIFNTFWSFWFDKPMEVFQFFRDRVGELSFTCFINYASDDYTSLRKNVEYFKTATLAEFFVVPPVLLFNYEPNLFRRDRHIYNFIKQNGYLRTICDEVYKLKKKEEEEKDQNEVLQFLASIPPFGFISGIIQLILANPHVLFVEWSNQINNIIQQHNQNIINVSNAILSKFTVDIAEKSVINISRETCLTICPILPYVVPDLISKIKLIKAYQSVKPKKKRNFNLSDVIKNLLARFYIDDKKVAFGTVNADGTACFTFKKETIDKLNPQYVTFDIYGLRKQVYWIPPDPDLLAIAQKMKLYVSNTDTWIEGIEQEWVRVYQVEVEGYGLKWIIGFEDLKGTPNPDFDYDDVMIYIFEEEDTYNLKVYGTFGSYTNYLYVEGIEEPIKCPARNRDWRKTQMPPDDYICALIIIDKRTLEPTQWTIYT